MRAASCTLCAQPVPSLKLHLITNLFYPDELAGAALYTDFARYFHRAGHDLRVTATFPYYPAWKLRPEDAGIPWRDEIFEGAPMRRVAMFVPRRPTGVTRMLSELS